MWPNIITAASALVLAISAAAWAFQAYLRARTEQQFRREQQYVFERMARRDPESLERLAPYIYSTETSSAQALKDIESRLDSIVSFQERALSGIVEEASYRSSSILSARLEDAISRFQHKLAVPVPEEPPVVSDQNGRPVAREIAHALLTPLARIEAITRLMGAKDGKTSRDVERLLSAVQICYAYLNAFRATGYSPTKEQRFSKAVADAADLYNEQLGTGVTVRVESPDHIDGQPYFALACALPLIENAIDASNEGDEVSIVVKSDAGSTIISVENPVDKPLDISRAVMDGFTTKDTDVRNHEGLGLGIARSLSASAGGKLSGKNLPGRVRFTITIPTAKP